MEIQFTINGKKFQANPKTIPIDTSLNTFIRKYALLPGTKFMCLEGGCGVCIVTVKGIHPVTKVKTTWAVNSCLFSIYSCQNMEIITVEGIGDNKVGYHPVQKRLADFNGTQCGYCSPGMVMNMYSLLESKNELSMMEIENSFGGNICRCTGYRPILDAFKSLAVDADEKLLSLCNKDIEDLSKTKCEKFCGKTFLLNRNVHLISDEDSKEWHKVFTITDVFKILETIGDRPYMFVAGNTAHGVYRRSLNLEVFIDVSGIEELHRSSIDEDIQIGANVSLTETMAILKEAAEKNENFNYGLQLVKHIDLIANVPVRNAGTLAGNLSLKHKYNEFPSDIFLILEASGAKLTIVDSSGKTICVSPQEYLKINMTKKIIKKITLPPIDDKIVNFKTYKIMPRAQNAHAFVNAGFRIAFINDDKSEIKSATICFGGISPTFIHADKTEKYLIGKNLFTNETLQEALKQLEDELKPDWILPDASPEFRSNLAISLFYKFVLGSSPENIIKSQFITGGSILERPLSSGTQSFETFEKKWPLTKNIPKLEAQIQCSGEALYVNDIPYQPGELYAAFVLANKVHSTIIGFEAEDALKLPGVHHFFSAKDIPGKNNFTPQKLLFIFQEEEILCSGDVLFYGQPAGIIVADDLNLAIQGASLVKIIYGKNNSNKKIIPSLEDVRQQNAFDRVTFSPELSKTAEQHGLNSTKKIKSRLDLGSQFHFTMEPQSCVCLPIEGGFEIYAATQWIDIVQIAISECLKIPENKINMQVRRIGGGFGAKISRANQIHCACALASFLTNQPIRFILPIETNMTTCGKRTSIMSDYEVEFDDNGKIQKLKNTFYEDHGCSDNEPIENFTSLAFANCYNKEAYELNVNSVKTDAPSTTWTRSPGTTEAMFMIENIMEHIALECGKSAESVRLQNIPDDNPLKKMIPDFIKSVDFESRKTEIDEFNKTNRWRKRGIAIVPMYYDLEYFGSIPILVAIYQKDGSVAISHGGIEMGQGINTKVAQVAAHFLSIPLEMISVKPASNVISANSIASGGSMTSEAVCFGVMNACQILLKNIKPVKDKMPESTWAEIIQACYAQNVEISTLFTYKSTDVKGYIIPGVCCGEIEVDILTGNLLIKRVDILEDTGESMSPGIDVGQIEGAFVMGIGYMLTEQLKYNRENGELLTNRTWTYKPPGAKDIPIDFRVKFLQKSKNPKGVLGSKATGEPALLMSVVILFALRRALNSARADAGIKDNWFHMGAPTTTENIFLAAGNDLNQYEL